MDIGRYYLLADLLSLSCDVEDITEGLLTHNGVKYPCIAVIFDGVLPQKDIDSLMCFKRVIKCGEGFYKYSPSTPRTIAYISKQEV